MTQRRRIFELTLNSHQYKMVTNISQSLVFTGRSCVTVCTSQKTVKNNRLESVSIFSILNHAGRLWFIIVYLVFFCLCKLLFSGFLQFEDSFEYGKNKSKYLDWETNRETTTMSQEQKYLLYRDWASLSIAWPLNDTRETTRLENCFE